jgi:pimeloyl-ACP methyl ester carboxylesterase
MAALMERHYVTVGDRQVHYQRAGTGPPVVLCHESPLSSWSLLDLVESLSGRFTALALDTPGYGGPDPLALESPEIEDYADALAQTLSALGIDRCGVYGAHTGAAIALEFACRHPDRVGGVVLDGLPVFTAEESVELLSRYLPTWPPRIDGGHLLGLWTRYRDQHLFFPWYRRDVAVRLDIDMPEPRHLQAGVTDFLRAGDGYRVAYAAAFRHRTVERLAHATVPVTVTARDDDLLAPQLERMPSGTSTELLPRDRDAWAARVGDLFAATPGQASTPPPPTATRLPGSRVTRCYVGSGGAQMLARIAGPDEGRPLLMAHGAPVSGAVLVALAARLGVSRPAIAFDLPGCGDSDPLPGGSWGPADYATAVCRASDALGLAAFDLYGVGEGAVVAAETAIQAPGRVRRLVLEGVPMHDAATATRLADDAGALLEPRWDGAHLVSAWAMLRDRTLFAPWDAPRREAIRWVPAVDAERLHLEVTELLKAYETCHLLVRAAAQRPPAERLRLLAPPTLVCADPHDQWHGAVAGAAALVPRGAAATLPVPLHARVAAIANFLDAPG